MKRFKKHLAALASASLMAALTLNFNACTEQSPLQSDATNVSDYSLAKKGGGGGPGGGDDGGSQDNSSYPQYAENTFTYNATLGAYTGGTVNVPGGTTLHLASGALTPPSWIPTGDPVTITMSALKKTTNKGKDVLEFTFGPHGSSFDPPVEVTFDWTDLGIDVATLFYIDKGKYVPQSADDIDIQNKKMTLSIHHFSRFAIGAEL